MTWREGISEDLLWGVVVGLVVAMAVLVWAIQDYTLVPVGMVTHE